MFRSRVWKHGEVAASLPDGERYLEPFVKGATSLGWYAPRGEDPQKPHDRDELYFIVTGSGWFEHGGQRSPFEPGDALFVAAGQPHRFVDFSDDFSAWVVFWGGAGERGD